MDSMNRTAVQTAMRMPPRRFTNLPAKEPLSRGSIIIAQGGMWPRTPVKGFHFYDM